MSDGVDIEIVKKTQQVLGKYIKKPPLTEKLLSKPPFRFLHDVIVAVIKSTGFLKDLFNQDELIADNVKEREAKLAFLNKLILAVKTITGIQLKVRASKIIAGAQPNETNLLLQAIAHGIDKKLDSSSYVKKINGKNEAPKVKKSSSREIKSDLSPKEEKSPTEQKIGEKRSKNKIREQSKDRKVPSKDNLRDKKEKKTPVSSSRTSKTDSKIKKEKITKTKVIDSPESASKTSEHESIQDKFSEKGEVENEAAPILDESRNNLEAIEEVNNQGNAITSVLNDDDRPKTRDIQSGYLAKMINNNKPSQEEIDFHPEINHATDKTSDDPFVEAEKNVTTPVIRQISARPKSARPKSGEFKEKIHHESQKKKAEQPAANGNIVLQTSSSQRPKSSLRPPSVRPSSARPGAPRLRPDSALPIQEVVPMGKINVIVENFDNNADDEETIVIHNAPEETTSVEPILDLPAKNQSHLVEQILDQIKDNEDSPKSKIDTEWEQDNLRGRDTTSKEMNQLRNLIQSFTKTANPLGKLLNYLHEDIETMHTELQQWIRIKSQLFSEIAKQEKLKLEMEKPLLEKLENLKKDIAKQEQEIVDVRANIIKNDIRIKELINK